jgi:hypothetical protein
MWLGINNTGKHGGAFAYAFLRWKKPTFFRCCVVLLHVALNSTMTLDVARIYVPGKNET